MLAINLSEMWPCIFGRYTNIIAAQIHLQCVSIKPSSQIKVTFSFQFQNYLFSTKLSIAQFYEIKQCFSGSENDWKRMIRSLENPGVYENPCGDLMLPALAHSLCVDIILFNTRRTSAPIYPVSSTVWGGQPSRLR